MKNKILFIVLVGVLIVSLLAFGACKTAPTEKETIKIGGLYSMTGFFSCPWIRFLSGSFTLSGASWE